MTVKVAATQFACDLNVEKNINKAEELVRKAAADGAQIILLQELFETLYFCQEENENFFKIAQPKDNYIVTYFSAIAKELGVVIPVSYFERDNNTYYNSVVIVDADGKVVGHYRKSHIPTGPGYEEKFYFSPGDTGFQVVRTKFAKISVLICWDQWFPEAVRSVVLGGAEIIFYPTAIGSEPKNPGYSSREHWMNVIKGHAGANMVPIVTSNRVGTEHINNSSITFYGSSFVTDQYGNVTKELNTTEESYIVVSLDLEEISINRAGWGVFRDRRPELYRLT